MKKVMIFGSFDVLHKGHYYVISEAQKLGNVSVVLARDETIENIKNQRPHFSAETRKKHLLKKYPSLDVHIGHAVDKLHWVKKIKPDIFVLGYDQVAFVDKLKVYCNKTDGTKLVVLDSYKPHKYKSSLVKRNKIKMFFRRLFH